MEKDNIPTRHTLDWFRELSHVTEADTALKYCIPAITSLQRRVRNDNIIVDDVPELYFAAAVLAYYRFSLTDDFIRIPVLKRVTCDSICSPKNSRQPSPNFSALR